MWVSRTGIIASSISSYDVDAQAFITAATITDVTQKNAINTLVVDLKSNSLWAKMRAIYPFVGGTATTHKWNLKDPRDLDAAFRLTFLGGGTHNSGGYTGNLAGSYANTNLNASIILSQNNIHISWYSNSNVIVSPARCDIGQETTGYKILGYSINGAGTSWVTRLNSTSTGSTATTDSVGFYQMSRTTSANILMQKNTTQATITQASTTPTNGNILLLASSPTTEFSNRQLQLVTIGEGLTASEMNALNTINDNFKTTLAR